jgi:hypothetical protein
MSHLGLGVPTVWPDNDLRLGAAFPPQGSRRVGSPASQVLCGAPTPCVPLSAPGFPRLGDTTPARLCFAPLGPTLDRRPGTIRVRLSRRSRHCRVETTRASHVHGEPAVLLPGSTTPANRTRLAITACSTWPPRCIRRRLPRRTVLSGLNRQASALAVYASSIRLLLPMQDSLRPLARRYRTGFACPTGFLRKV